MTFQDTIPDMIEDIFMQCQQLFPAWSELSLADFDFDDPKGFSSFTMGIRSRRPAEPAAVLYRRLDGKENAILDFETEKEVFLSLSANGIAAQCYHYNTQYRVEQFYKGRTLERDDLFKPDILQGIANQLHRFHNLPTPNVPASGFFELLHNKWGTLAKQVLEVHVDSFPANEQEMCEELREIYSDETARKVAQCLPQGEVTFCHNDTYHGNIMKLANGDIKLLDFEFSCLNHKAYDFSNLFAETVMRHQQSDYPYFRIADPEFGDQQLGTLINFYLDNEEFESSSVREVEFNKLLTNTNDLLKMSDYKYAMAALPLALNPIQKIRFIPYAHQRFKKFLAACGNLE